MRFTNRWVMTGLAMLLPVAPAWAEWKPSPAEMAALPPYCAARFDESSAAFASWKANMGSDFIHIHHYCAGLNFLNRARSMASSDKNRTGTLEAALRNFNYVLTNTHPDFYLQPDFLMNRGITYSMLHKDSAAVGDLLKAIEMDPKLARAYVTLADMYEKQTNRSKALETVTEGLRHNPDTRSLQRRYSELGGKLPYPAPITTAPVGKEAPAVKSDLVGPAATAEAPAQGPAVEPAKIGTPTNPFCRFCPD
jgi:tetratricopeptide (TPR) repeat protein